MKTKGLDTKKSSLRFRQVIEIKAADNGSIPTEIQLFKPGHWDTPYHGEFMLNSQIFSNMINNFNSGVRGRPENGLPIDREHYSDGGAAGWIKTLEDRGEEGLWGQVEWTADGADDLKAKRYKFFSPEWAPVYQDPQQADVFYEDVLCGGGLTNRPLFKGLEPIVASEEGRKDLTQKSKDNIIYVNNSERGSMNLKDILKKANEEVTDEEREFLKANIAEISLDDQVKYELAAEGDSCKMPDGNAGKMQKDKNGKMVCMTEKKKNASEDEDDEEDSDDTDDDNKDDNKGTDDTDTGDTTDDNDDNTDDTEGDEAKISASELRVLKKQANEGAQALMELNKMKANEKIESMLFNSKGGKFPPAMKNKLADFYSSLNKKQATEFESIVKEMPEAKLYSEIGEDVDKTGEATKKIQAMAEAKMKENEKLTFSEAVIEVSKENPELANQYSEEVQEDSVKSSK